MHILIADSRQPLRNRLVPVLRHMGHLVAEAASPDLAKSRMDAAEPPVDIVVFSSLDEELLRHARGKKPAPFLLFLAEPETLSPAEEAALRGDLDDCIAPQASDREIQLRVQLAARILRAERGDLSENEHLASIVRQQTDGIRRTHNEILARIFNAMETSGEETDSHVRRVGWISACMATLLGWDRESVDALKAAAALHDLGKISIPDAVLRKPGALNAAEYALAKEHAAIGSRILSGSSDPVVRMAARIAMHHHEHWDGTGYPQRLAGEAIPMEARIAAIADVYDALISERVYRTAYPDEEAVRIIREGAGSKFDPSLCAVFLDNLDTIRHYCAEEEKFLSRGTFTPTE